MKNKIIISIVAIALIVFGFTIQSTRTETAPIKIGVILPLSGDLSFIGEPAKYGAEMALENFKDTKHKYELVFEDDQFDGKKAVTAAQKLISVDKVNVLVTFGSSGGNSVKPLAETNKILHFTVASDQKIADGKYNFNHWTSPKEEVTTMVAELIKNNIKTVSILTMNQDGMISTTNELKEQLKNTNIRIIDDEKFNVGTRDFRTLAAKVKLNQPEQIIMVNYSPELEILGRQIRETGIKVPMTSFEGLDATTDPKLFAGSWYSTASDVTEAFKNTFKAKYSVAPIVGTGNVHDVISMLITATENVRGSVTTEKIASELLKIKDFDGSIGRISMDQNGSVVSKAVIKTVVAK
jgi:branched-chain amino acid transport system substrate-binding protein